MPIQVGQQKLAGKPVAQNWETYLRSPKLYISDESGKVTFQAEIRCFKSNSTGACFVGFSKPGFVPLRAGEEATTLETLGSMFTELAKNYPKITFNEIKA